VHWKPSPPAGSWGSTTEAGVLLASIGRPSMQIRADLSADPTNRWCGDIIPSAQFFGHIAVFCIVDASESVIQRYLSRRQKIPFHCCRPVRAADHVSLSNQGIGLNEALLQVAGEMAACFSGLWPIVYLIVGLTGRVAFALEATTSMKPGLADRPMITHTARRHSGRMR